MVLLTLSTLNRSAKRSSAFPAEMVCTTVLVRDERSCGNMQACVVSRSHRTEAHLGNPDGFDVGSPRTVRVYECECEIESIRHRHVSGSFCVLRIRWDRFLLESHEFESGICRFRCSGGTAGRRSARGRCIRSLALAEGRAQLVESGCLLRLDRLSRRVVLIHVQRLVSLRIRQQVAHLDA